jgi:predicted porin
MKKSLIALAVLGSVAGMAQAQSSVTLYGLADIWVGSTKAEINGVGSSVTKVDGSGLATSRFGLKGSEDLGGGLKANFQLEQGFNIDNGTAGNSTGTAGSQAFDRQAWVGLSGGFGEVQFGKTWSSYDDIRSSANDNFNANVAASFNTWVGYTDRPVNSIKYISPTVGGFSGSVTYGLGEDKLANANGKSSSLTSLGLQYANGPVFVGLAYQAEKDGATDTKFTNTLINGSYDFGMAKLVAGYNQAKDTLVAGKANEWNVGVEVPLAANLNLGLGYAQSKEKIAGVDSFKTTGYTASLLYSLSKRTTVYGVLSQTKGKDIPFTTEAKGTLYAVGINHKF